MSVKLWKAEDDGLNGRFRWKEPKWWRKWSSDAGKGEEIAAIRWGARAKVVRVDKRVRDTGRIMDRRAPRPMILRLSGVKFYEVGAVLYSRFDGYLAS